MINFAANLNKMINAGLGGPLDPPRTEVAVGHRVIYTEVSGDVVNFESNVIAPVKNLRVTMEPIQDLHGYDQQWPAGGGKNKFDKTAMDSNNGYVANYYLNANGFEGASSNFDVSEYIPVKASTAYTLHPCSGYAAAYGLYDANKVWLSGGRYDSASTVSFTTTEDTAYIRVSIPKANVATLQLEEGSSATTFAPYSNICPITGRESVTVYRSGADMSDPRTVTIQLGQTVYGGTVDVTTGVIKVDWANIASYDGETLPDEWISDRDVYSPGATPTTGAQVCYKLAEPLTIQLSPQTINSLLGQNNVWSDAGNISLEYPYYEETEGY